MDKPNFLDEKKFVCFQEMIDASEKSEVIKKELQLFFSGILLSNLLHEEHCSLLKRKFELEFYDLLNIDSSAYYNNLVTKNISHLQLRHLLANKFTLYKNVNELLTTNIHLPVFPDEIKTISELLLETDHAQDDDQDFS